MILTLVGPDNSGFWFLENQLGMTWQIVERWEGHPAAAKLFGWISPEGLSDDELIDAAREFLIESIGTEIEAPLHFAQHFEQLEREAVEEVVSEFFGVKKCSTFEVVEDRKGRVGFRIQGPKIEVEDAE